MVLEITVEQISLIAIAASIVSSIRGRVASAKKARVLNFATFQNFNLFTGCLFRDLGKSLKIVLPPRTVAVKKPSLGLTYIGQVYYLEHVNSAGVTIGTKRI